MPIDDTKTFTINIMRPKRIQKWVIAFTNYFDPKFFADHFDLIAMGFTGYQRAQQIKDINPNIIILGYLNAMTTQHYFSNWDEIDSQESMFCHTGQDTLVGDYWTRVRHTHWCSFLMNPNPVSGWTAFYANWCVQRMNNYPMYDGIFGDDCWHVYHGSWGISLTEDPADCDLQLIDDYNDVEQNFWDNYPDYEVYAGSWLYQHIQVAQLALGSTIYMPNAGRDYIIGRDVTGWHCYQTFMHTYGHSITSTGNESRYWYNRMVELESLMTDGVKLAVNSGTGGVADPYNMTADEEQLAHFWMISTYCCFALIVNNPVDSYYSFSINDYQHPEIWWSEMDTMLGDPLGTRQKIDTGATDWHSVWYRHFENVTIAMNLSDTTAWDVEIDGIPYHFDIREGKILPPP